MYRLSTFSYKNIDSSTIRDNRINGLVLSNSEGLVLNSTSKGHVDPFDGFGLVVAGASTATLRSNVFTSNTSDVGLSFGGAIVELGPNQCGANTTCP